MTNGTGRPALLLCGGTGDLGSRIAARQGEHGIAFRALVRPASDPMRLQSLGAEVSVGDLTDRASLDRALRGIRTVVTTANSMTAALAGDRSGSIDVWGNENLVRAAEATGVERFVFVSAAALTDEMVRLSPFLAAKRQTERTLQASTLRAVLVQPAPFQEIWTSPEAGIRPLEGEQVSPEPLRRLGIEPRPTSELIAQMAHTGRRPSPV